MAILLISFFVAGLFIAAIRSPRTGLFIAVFLSPWMGLDADVGLRITGYRLAIFALVLALGLRMLSSKRSQRNVRNKNLWLSAFIAYILFASVYHMFALPMTILESGSLRSGLLRPISQIVMFGMELAPIFIIPLIVRKTEDIIECGKVYLWSVSILAVIGWVQLFIWYGTGTDPFPIGFVGSLVSGSTQLLRSGIDYVGSVPVYRMSSFGGEPKGLAQGLAVGLLLLQTGVTSISAVAISKRKIFLLWCFLMLSLLLTWSTSGIFLWLIGTVTITLLGLGGLAKKQSRKAFVSGLILLTLVMAIVTVVPTGTDKKGYGGIVSSMVTNRFVERGIIEDFDEVILSFLKDRPEYLLAGVGLGNVHVYAQKYIPPYAMHYMAGNIFVAKSGYLRFVSELGLIGLMFFIFALVRILYLHNNVTKRTPLGSKEKMLGHVLYAIGIVTFVGGMSRTYIWPQMFLVLGLCTAYPLVLYWQQCAKVPISTISQPVVGSNKAKYYRQ